jgi:hypothetical protein
VKWIRGCYAMPRSSLSKKYSALIAQYAKRDTCGDSRSGPTAWKNKQLDLGGMGYCKHSKMDPEFLNAVGTHSVVVVVK